MDEVENGEYLYVFIDEKTKWMDENPIYIYIPKTKWMRGRESRLLYSILCIYIILVLV